MNFLQNFYQIKKIVFLLILFFAATYSLHSVPAYPHPIEYKQPDGSVITIQLKGDEKVNWAETPDGYTILVTREGYYEYAVIDKNGDLTFSGIRVSSFEKRSAEEQNLLKEIPKGLRFSERQVEKMKSVWEMKTDRSQKGFPTTGEQTMICILMETPDVPFTKTQAEFDALFNQLNYTVGGATGSVKDYYIENSYGQFELTVDVVGPYTAEHDMAHYGSTWEGARELAAEAVHLADPDVDYSDYDNSGDGSVDGIYMIFAGYGEEAGGGPNTIWSHAWSIWPAIHLDGVQISRYACSPELRGNSGTNITRIGVIGHEFGHILGAPDYYDTGEGVFTGTGRWDMMASGTWNNGGATPAHHNAFTKVYIYEWATPTILDSQKSVTLNNAAEYDDSFYRVNTQTHNEYYLLENREKHLFDAYIPGNGMIIYHVHRDVLNVGNSVNATHPQKMYPVCAGASTDPNETPSSYGPINSAQTPFPGSTNQTAFTDETTPSSLSWAGQETGKSITNISRDAANKTVSFDFMEDFVPPQPVTFNVTDQNGNPVENALITITPVEDRLAANPAGKKDGRTERQAVSRENVDNESMTLLTFKDSPEPTPVFSKTDDDGEWIHWDDGINEGSIGAGEGVWYGAIRFETADIVEYDEMAVTLVRTYLNHLADATSVIIWQGEEGNLSEVVYKPFTPVQEDWIEVELDEPYMIDTDQELWIGIEISDPGDGVFPLGRDAETDYDGKGNLVSFNGVDWYFLYTDYDIEGDWNIQAFVTTVGPLELITDVNGQAGFEAKGGEYEYVVEKEDYITVEGGFVVDEEPLTVDVTLYREAFVLELLSDPPAGGSVNGAGEYSEGETVAVSATANPGFEFVNWTDSEHNEVSSTAEFDYTMPADDVTLTANFELEDENLFILSLETNPLDGGTTEGQGAYEEGIDVTLAAFANEGYEFVNWTNESDDVISSEESFDYTMPGEDVTITANFELIDYELNVNVNPENTGSITFIPEQDYYNFKDKVELEALPEEGFRFLNWEGDTEYVEGELDSEKIAVNMPSENVYLTANFELIVYTVSFVVEDKDGNSIENAVIELGEMTNDEGDYVFEDIVPGVYDYIISAEDYFDATGTVEVVDDDVNEEVAMNIDDTFVDEQEEVKLSVFPNPTRDKFNVESSEMIRQVRLLDISGQLILNENVDGTHTEVNVHSLRAGIYFMQIHTAENVMTKRVQIIR